METIDGVWIMHGVAYDDPKCLHTVDDAIDYINEIGFMPLFKNDIPGFSIEERTVPEYWWCGNAEHDPWVWREIIARRGDIVYGKFFNKKAGFISKRWFPYFANYRRDGYDFDARWDDELASMRQKKIMDLFNEDTELFSYEIKQQAGFGKGGEKNFEGTIASLEMQTYLCAKDFKRKRNKAGKEYGWDVVVYSLPEHIYGYEHVASAYKEEPEKSFERIYQRVEEMYPEAEKKHIKAVIK